VILFLVVVLMLGTVSAQGIDKGFSIGDWFKEILGIEGVLFVYSPQNGVSYESYINLDYSVEEGGIGLDQCWYSLDGQPGVLMNDSNKQTVTTPKNLIHAMYYLKNREKLFTAGLGGDILAFYSPSDLSNYDQTAIPDWDGYRYC